MEEPNKLKIQIISTETIKPSSPTPNNLKHFNLNIYDQFNPPNYVGIVFFYPHVVNGVDRNRVLKSSLSETLTRFYPLAGRTVEGELFIDCNDAGVDYVEARVVGTRLSDVLHCPDPKELFQLLPMTKTTSYAEFGTGCLVRVQANAFDCGGMALSVCFCHKVVDASAMGAFIKGWAAAARGCGDTVVPEFNLSARFPAVPFSAGVPSVELIECKCTTRRYVFYADQIKALKVKVASARVAGGPTRVEAVTALVWKCIIETSRSKSVDSKNSKPCLVARPVNIRKRLDPPFSQYSIGNLIGLCVARINNMTESNDVHIQELGEEGLKIFCEAVGTYMRSEDEDLHIFSSWCGFPLYEADFGWGKPVWVSIADKGMKNNVVMIDTSDGDGIEVWMTLLEQDMILFEKSSKLLEFASSNPSIFIGRKEKTWQ